MALFRKRNLQGKDSMREEGKVAAEKKSIPKHARSTISSANEERLRIWDENEARLEEIDAFSNNPELLNSMDDAWNSVKALRKTLENNQKMEKARIEAKKQNDLKNAMTNLGVDGENKEQIFEKIKTFFNGKEKYTGEELDDVMIVFQEKVFPAHR